MWLIPWPRTAQPASIAREELVSTDFESVEGVALLLRSAMESADLEAIADLLAVNVTWGPPGDSSPPCRKKRQVLEWYERGKNSGASAHVSEVVVRGNHVLMGLVVSGTRGARDHGGHTVRWQVFTIADGHLTDIVGFDQRNIAIEWVDQL